MAELISATEGRRVKRTKCVTYSRKKKKMYEKGRKSGTEKETEKKRKEKEKNSDDSEYIIL